MAVKSAQQILDSQEFKALVSKRWTVSLILLILLFVVYFGYIFLIAWDKPLMASKIGEATTLGIPLGVLTIVLAWVLTAVYLIWANTSYDVDVKKLTDQM